MPSLLVDVVPNVPRKANNDLLYFRGVGGALSVERKLMLSLVHF